MSEFLNFTKPLGSSFRIEDILVKSETSMPCQNQSSSLIMPEFNNSSNSTVKFHDLTNDSSHPFNLKKITKSKNVNPKEDEKSTNPDSESQQNSARLMSALSTLYDMSCYYPNINMFMNNNKHMPSFGQNQTQSLFNGDAVVAAAALALSSASNSSGSKKPFGLFNNSASNYLASPAQFSPLLMSSNNSLNEFNSKFNTSDNAVIKNNASEVKNTIRLCRRRKARTVFSDQQLSGLEKRFESQKYLSTPERVELANNLGLSETQVNKLRNILIRLLTSLAATTLEASRCDFSSENSYKPSKDLGKATL